MNLALLQVLGIQSPKLRMVSWNPYNMRFVSVIEHPLLIIFFKRRLSLGKVEKVSKKVCSRKPLDTLFVTQVANTGRD